MKNTLIISYRPGHSGVWVFRSIVRQVLLLKYGEYVLFTLGQF